MNQTDDGRMSRTIYWIATMMAAVAFAIPGAANLARVPHIAHDMALLGYPPYFLTVLARGKCSRRLRFSCRASPG
jgi:hypothetical protein